MPMDDLAMETLAMLGSDHVLGGDDPLRSDGSSIKLSSSGTRLEESSVLRDGSSLRKVILQLRTERVSIRPPAQAQGEGFAVLVIRGGYLALKDSPVATERPLPGGRTMLFHHRSCAALWGALRAWEDLADGRPSHMYHVRRIRYTGAVCCYTLRIVEGPLCCDLVGMVDAKEFVIPARGLEKPKTTALVSPGKTPPQPHRFR